MNSYFVVVFATFVSITVGNPDNQNVEFEIIKQLPVILEEIRSLRTMVTVLQDKYEILRESYNDLRLKCEKDENKTFLYGATASDYLGDDNERSSHPSTAKLQLGRKNASLLQQTAEMISERHENVENRRDAPVGDLKSKRLLLPTVDTNPPANQLVAFFVRVSGTILHLGDNQIIPLQRVLVDTAKAYHADTGIFEAPRDGLYAFFATITTKPDSVTYEIVKNGANVAYGLSENNSQHFASSSISTLIQLSTGDHVYLRIHGTAHSGAGEVIGSFSHFMGFSLN